MSDDLTPEERLNRMREEFGRPLKQLSVEVVRHAIERAEQLTERDTKPRALVMAPWQASDEIVALVAASSLELRLRSNCPASTVYTLPLSMVRR